MRSVIIEKKPKDFEDFLRLLEQDGYLIKRGEHIALRRKGQDRFLRFRSLGEGYTEEDIRAVILGEKNIVFIAKRSIVQIRSGLICW